jgi:oligopeptidase B
MASRSSAVLAGAGSLLAAPFVAPALFSLAALGAAAFLARVRAVRLLPPRAARAADAVVLVGAVGRSARARAARGPGAMRPPERLPDPYHWLRDDARASEAVLAHVRAENDFCGASLGAALAPGAERLYRELLSRLKETDEAAPVPRGVWLYSTRTEKGLSYALHCRRRAAARAGDGPGPEVVVLDENALAAGHAFLDVAGVEPSPCHSLVAYAVDTSGGETYAIVFKGAEDATPRAPTFAAAAEAAEDEEEDEEDNDEDDDDEEDAEAEAIGVLLPEAAPAAAPAAPGVAGAGTSLGGAGLGDVLLGSNGELEWGADARSLFYLTMDKAHRPFRLWRHAMGTPQREDTLLYQEDDERFWLGLSKTTSGDLVVLESGSKLTSEVRLVPLTARVAEALGGGVGVGGLALVAAREQGVLYDVDHLRLAGGDGGSSAVEDMLLVTTNRGGPGATAVNFRLCGARLSPAGRQSRAWLDLLPPSRSVYLTGASAFARFVAIEGREGGCASLWVARSADVGAAMRVAEAAAVAAAAAVRGAPAPDTAGPACLPALPAPRFPLSSVPAADAAFSLGIGSNCEYEAEKLRFYYTSPTTPPQTCELDVAKALAALVPLSVAGAAGPFAAVRGDPTHARVIKAKEVPNCDPSLYATRRLWASAPDGERVPITLLFRPSAHGLPDPPRRGAGVGAADADGAAAACPFPSGPAPLLLYAYGSYGHALDPSFSTSQLSLCDRGVVYALAHVRGGSEMGRSWYEEGK